MEYSITKYIGEEKEDRDHSSNFSSTGEKKGIDLEKILGALRKNYLVGKEVSVYTEDGYHYGVLQGFDKDFVYLGSYVFDKKKLSVMDYSSKACYSKAVVPRENVKSMYEIPLSVRKEKYE